MRGFVPTPPKIVDYMVARLFTGRPPKPGDTLLDPGCGPGAFLEGVVRWCRSTRNRLPRLVGIESEPARAQEARQTFRSVSQVTIRQSDFLGKPSESFDFIIGNPPFVSILELSEDEKESFRANYETARGRFDLYLLFFERALRSLKPNGRMVFITPEKFLYVDTAAPLRRLLSQRQVEEITLIDEQIFEGLVTYPTITTLVNREPFSKTLAHLRDGVERRCILNGKGASWMPQIRGAADHESRGRTLRDLCVRISCGVATGADEIFVREANHLGPALARFARPTIAGRELTKPGEIGQTRYAMLTPYADDASLLKETELRALGNYLAEPTIRARLMRRTCVRRKPWYSFHETPPLPDILRPKILCKDITGKPHFWIDRKGELVPRHSVYYIVPMRAAIIDRLCEYLNSAEVSNWLFEHCQRAANGFIRLQSNVLKMIPLPDELWSIEDRSGTLSFRFPHSENAHSALSEAGR